MSKDYLNVNDENLAELAQSGDMEAMDLLLIKYKPFVKAKASRMFIAGADRDDVIQEGMIGLFKAVRAFDPRRETAFSSLASKCIMSQIKDAVRTASTNKQSVLNDSINCEDISEGITNDSPEKLFISREKFRELREYMESEMTPFERKSLLMISLGYSYDNTASILGKSKKSIDGAVQRARKKLNIYRSGNN